MPKVYDNLAVNGNAGDWVDVTLHIHARRVILDEDPTNGAAQGMDYVLPNDDKTFTLADFRTLAAGEQLKFGNEIAMQNGYGFIVGTPGYASGGNTVPATVIAKLRSHTAAVTKYRISETE